MAKYQYRVQIGDSFTDIYNFTSITATRGRQQIQDPFRAGTCVITGRKPESLPSIKVGDKIIVTLPNVPVGSPIAAPLELFLGRVANFRINYGFVNNEDTWEMQCESILAEAGRKLVTASWSAGVTTGQAAAALSSVNPFITGGGFSRVSAQSFTDANLLDILNRLAATEQALIYTAGSTTLFFQARDAFTSKNFRFSFTDGSVTTPTPQTNFDIVTFKSYADSYYTKVVIEPQGLPPQTAGTGDRVFSMSTYDQTTSQAADLAAYVLSTLSVDTGEPSTISCFGETQTNNEAIVNAARADRGGLIGVGLRGVLRYAFILGSTVTASPEQTRITFYLAPYKSEDFFTLDIDYLGVLDSNKLGF